MAVVASSSASKHEALFSKELIGLMFANFFLFCSFQIWPSALPVYASHLGVSDEFLGWMTGLTTLASVAMRPVAGWLLDRLGRKCVFMAGLFVLGASTVLLALFPVFGAILGIRFLQGLGWGVSSTASNTVASDVIPKKRFAEGMGYFSLTASLAMAIAPGVGLELVGRAGIGATTAVSVGCCGISLALAFVLTYRNLELSKRPFNAKGLIAREAVTPSVVMFFVTLCYGGVVTFVALHAAARGIAATGLFFVVYALSTLLSRPLVGKFVDRVGIAPSLYAGLVFVALTMVVICFGGSLETLLVAAVVYGVGNSASQSALQTMAVAVCPPQRRGGANATFMMGFDLGIGVGSIVSGLLAGMLGYAYLFLALASFPVVAGVLFALFAGRAK